MELSVSSEQRVCKRPGDPTLQVGDYVMVLGVPKRVIHLTYVNGIPRGIIVEPKICDMETLMREQRDACHRAILHYVRGVRDGSIEPTEAGEAYLFKELPDRYLGNGRFVGVDT